MDIRGSGILLHITSLPSQYGIGDLGPEAYTFVDMLAEAKQQYWQVLPLTPIDPIYGYSPYSSSSAFAGNVFLVSPDMLIKEKLLHESDIGSIPNFSNNQCDYDKAIAFKSGILDKAFARFKENNMLLEPYQEFCSKHDIWLDDFALFVVIKKYLHQQAWGDWPKKLTSRNEAALTKIKKEKKEEIQKEKFFQFLFYRQWFALKKYCNEKGVSLIGDIPIYVSYDSVDVWAHSDLFKLDENRKPLYVAGVPPDYFSKTGQLWGNPVYQWDVMKSHGFHWWRKRIEHKLQLFDIVRVDHFRGLVAYWEIPAGEKTAINGHWEKVPVNDFFDTLKREFPELPILAEDLGLITDDVKDVLNQYRIPGMKLLLFAFYEDNPFHPYLPHMYEKNCIAYTGTHDNNTIQGWLRHETQDEDKKRLFAYIGSEVSGEDVNRELMRLAMMSVANVVIFPMQDILYLGEEARMNTPSVGSGNWQWRLEPEQLTPSRFQTLSEFTMIYGRIPNDTSADKKIV